MTTPVFRAFSTFAILVVMAVSWLIVESFHGYMHPYWTGELIPYAMIFAIPTFFLWFPRGDLAEHFRAKLEKREASSGWEEDAPLTEFEYEMLGREETYRSSPPKYGSYSVH